MKFIFSILIIALSGMILMNAWCGEPTSPVIAKHDAYDKKTDKTLEGEIYLIDPTSVMMNKSYRVMNQGQMFMSGSREPANMQEMTGILKSITENEQRGERHILWIDLRQETHFFVGPGDEKEEVLVSASVFRKHDQDNSYLESIRDIKNSFMKRIEFLKSLRGENGKDPVKFYVEERKNGDIEFPLHKKQISLDGVLKVLSERQFLQQAHAMVDACPPKHFVTLPTRDHHPPTEIRINEFINLLKKYSPDQYWYHVHCKGGAGRTTFFLVMLDMVGYFTDASADKNESLDYFVERQKASSGYDIAKTNSPDPMMTEFYQKRVAMLQTFYEYAKSQKGKALADWDVFKIN